MVEKAEMTPGVVGQETIFSKQTDQVGCERGENFSSAVMSFRLFALTECFAYGCKIEALILGSYKICATLNNSFYFCFSSLCLDAAE